MKSNGIFKNSRGRLMLMLGAVMMMAGLGASDTFAWGHFGHHGFGHRGFRHGGYYFHGGFYQPRHFWFDSYVAAPPLGTFVNILPYGYVSFSVGGLPYYYFDGIFFRPCPEGYVVTSDPRPVKKVIIKKESSDKSPEKSEAKPDSSSSKEPAAQSLSRAPAESSASGDTVTVNIPNKSGGFTPVTLVKLGDGYIGPQKEFYAGHPTVAQLQVLYGN